MIYLSGRIKMLSLTKIKHRTSVKLLMLALLFILIGCGGGGGDAVSVDGAAVTNASLTWTPPTTRMNGSTLFDSDIASYKVYYGTTISGPYPNIVPVAKSACTPSCVATITGLSSGTYYFVVTVIDTAAYESGYSTEVVKVI